MNIKKIILTICIAIAYTALSAQSKGFTDTVILKNGTVLSGVKATVTKDSLVVTNPEGETSVFTKKEVSEVKKGGGNSTNVIKPDTKPTPSSGKWSEFQGQLTWEDAKAKCKSIGMRLPTIVELTGAYNAGIMQSWDPQGGGGIWSSKLDGVGNAYVISIAYGNFSAHPLDFNYFVRCIR